MPNYQDGVAEAMKLAGIPATGVRGVSLAGGHMPITESFHREQMMGHRNLNPDPSFTPPNKLNPSAVRGYSVASTDMPQLTAYHRELLMGQRNLNPLPGAVPSNKLDPSAVRGYSVASTDMPQTAGYHRELLTGQQGLDPSIEPMKTSAYTQGVKEAMDKFAAGNPLALQQAMKSGITAGLGRAVASPATTLGQRGALQANLAHGPEIRAALPMAAAGTQTASASALGNTLINNPDAPSRLSNWYQGNKGWVNPAAAGAAGMGAANMLFGGGNKDDRR